MELILRRSPREYWPELLCGCDRGSGGKSGQEQLGLQFRRLLISARGLRDAGGGRAQSSGDIPSANLRSR